MPRSRLCFVLLLCLSAVEANAARAAEIGLAGGDNILWIYQTRIDAADAVKQLYLAFMPLDREPRRFRPLNQSETGGEVVRAAVRGRRLHAFFRDGTHVRVEPEVRRVAGPQAIFWELELPDAAVPLAVVGDAVADVLYAVVPARIAEAVDAAAVAEEEGDMGTAGAAPFPASRPADEPARPGLEIRPAPLVTPVTQPALTTRPALGKFCLVRYERGRWRRDRDVPDTFDGQAGCLISAEKGTCDLYFVRKDQGEKVWFMRGDDEGWSVPETVENTRWERLLACRRHGGWSQALFADEPGLVLLVRDREIWRRECEIATPSESGVSPSGTFRSGGLAAGLISAAWKDESGRVLAALWKADGQLDVAPHAVDALFQPPSVEGLQTFREVAPFVVLGMSLIYVFSRRRESVVTPATLLPDQRLAGYGRRVAAFMLDMVVVAPIALPMLYGWARHVESDGDVLENVQVAMAEQFAELFWRWFLALGVFVVYAAVFEAARGGTPGKLLLRCRVVTEQGERCGLRAIVMRNLLRVVELFPGFDFAPLLLLVFLTRNRQRLGDLAARSVVVEQQRSGRHPQQDGVA